MQIDQEQNTNHSIKSAYKGQSFAEFLNAFKSSINRAFHEIDNIDAFCSTRGFPPSVLKELMSVNPLALCIPKEHGGFGATIKQNLSFISAAAYESLPFSLMLGINNGLFIQPVSKYGQAHEKARVFDQFINHGSMGGLMITEPDFGSDALNMQTAFSEHQGVAHLKGKKHWAGLTGMADFWLLTARRKSESGKLMRDIDMFICEVNAPRQNIVVEEYFENLGLYQIPYGRNLIDVHIPLQQRLIPQTTGVQMMLDLLHRSRFQFPAMGLGFIKRMLDEAIHHAHARIVGNKGLIAYDLVQNRLSTLQAYYTICSAFCLKSSQIAKVENDLASLGLEANSIKCVTTDMMQNAAQSLLQLVGAKGYQLNHIAGKSMVDSRPFQIFEGSNDILYHQIADSLLKRMKSANQQNLFQFFNGYSKLAAKEIQPMINFELNPPLSQRKLVDLGKVVSRIIAMDHLFLLEKKGFRKELISNALVVLKQEISTQLNEFNFKNTILVIEDYEEMGLWADL